MDCTPCSFSLSFLLSIRKSHCTVSSTTCRVWMDRHEDPMQRRRLRVVAIDPPPPTTGEGTTGRDADLREWKGGDVSFDSPPIEPTVGGKETGWAWLASTPPKGCLPMGTQTMDPIVGGRMGNIRRKSTSADDASMDRGDRWKEARVVLKSNPPNDVPWDTTMQEKEDVAEKNSGKHRECAFPLARWDQESATPIKKKTSNHRGVCCESESNPMRSAR